MIIRRFLSGFVSILPIINNNKRGIKYFPSEIFKNDWRMIENNLLNLRKMARSKDETK